MNFGIICEFNPFHKGHLHLINSVKKSKNDAIICAMSGNFVQRGEFAIENKYDRARTALENGADLVIEIPTLCSTQSAQGFAMAGVDILEGCGVCDTIAFGAECDDIEELKRISKEIIDKDEGIKAELSKGVSYPVARQNVVNSPILDSPNNILAIEYLTHTNLDAVAIKRIGKGHDTDDSEYSASAIRNQMNTDDICSMKNCEKAILYKLRTMSADDFKAIEDVSEGLENRIVDVVRTANSLEEIYDGIKSKRYTHSRIRRIILRAYLGITKDMPKRPQYLHILGFNDKGRELLAEMKKASTLPIITKYGNAEGEIKELFDLECRFTDIYNLGYKNAQKCGTEQTSKVIML